MDEAAGAINRREVAKKQYDEESSIYQDFFNSWRGSISSRFIWKLAATCLRKSNAPQLSNGT
jgi:hypothetical protein